jgi:hypothetical protein
MEDIDQERGRIWAICTHDYVCLQEQRTTRCLDQLPPDYIGKRQPRQAY